MTRILWDVDTQVDFVHADGKLAVPGCGRSRARDGAARRGGARGRDPARRVGRRPRADRRRDLRDARLRDDLSAALPARDARRARRCPRREQADPVPLGAHRRARALAARPRVPAAEEELRRLHEPERRAPARRLDPEEIVLFGVATDVCDDAAIRGLLARGRSRHVRRGGVARARRGPNAPPASRPGARRGVEFTTAEEVGRRGFRRSGKAADRSTGWWSPSTSDTSCRTSR